MPAVESNYNPIENRSEEVYIDLSPPAGAGLTSTPEGDTGEHPKRRQRGSRTQQEGGNPASGRDWKQLWNPF